MSLLALESVTRSFRKGGQEIAPLRDLSLAVEEGDFCVLCGPSGSGKTTLLNLLAGLDRPDRGRVLAEGRDLAGMSGSVLDRWRGRTLGLVFQQPRLLPVLTAAENVELPLWLLPLSAAERRQRVALSLSVVGLADRAGHLPRELSGGQEQRVALARALVTGARVLLCDEPTGNLDRDTAEELLELLSRLHREQRRTIVLVTHDPRAARRATRCLQLEAGVLQPLAAGPAPGGGAP